MRTKYPSASDIVRIVTPKIFIRCGYPLSPQVILETRKKEVDKLVAKGLKAIGCGSGYKDIKYGRAEQHIQKAVVSIILNKEHFGGTTRAIYEKDVPELENSLVKIVGKRFVKTGEYEGASGDGYWSEYEPAGLYNEQTHCILKVGLEDVRHLTPSALSWYIAQEAYDDYFEIRAAYVG